MPMSKKTYELVAQVTKVNWLASKGKPAAEAVCERMVRNYVDAFSRDNERFDLDRFLDAAVPRFARARYDLGETDEPNLFDEPEDPCCLLFKQHYGEDHEYDCPKAIKARAERKQRMAR